MVLGRLLGKERTIRRQADRFEVEGMVSLFRPTKHQETDDHRSLYGCNVAACSAHRPKGLSVSLPHHELRQTPLYVMMLSPLLSATALLTV